MNQKMKQTKPSISQLDQVALLKKFIGTWQNKFDADAFIIYTIKPFGKGLEATYQVATDEKTLLETRQLVGFDPEYKTFTNFNLNENGLVVQFQGKFISENRVSLDVYDWKNPEQVIARTEFEFHDKDMFTVTQILGNLGGKPGVYYRIKE